MLAHVQQKVFPFIKGTQWRGRKLREARFFTLLKTGGSAGIIIPQGVLFGPSGDFVEARKKLVGEAETKAVIFLLSDVFKPYAGVATAILVFTRGGKTEHTCFHNLAKDGLHFHHAHFTKPAQLFLFTGLLGGFTTFSTFGWETFALLQDGNPRGAFLYGGGSVFLGLLAVWIGYALCGGAKG